MEDESVELNSVLAELLEEVPIKDSVVEILESDAAFDDGSISFLNAVGETDAIRCNEISCFDICKTHLLWFTCVLCIITGGMSQPRMTVLTSELVAFLYFLFVQFGYVHVSSVCGRS